MYMYMHVCICTHTYIQMYRQRGWEKTALLVSYFFPEHEELDPTALGVVTWTPGWQVRVFIYVYTFLYMYVHTYIYICIQLLWVSSSGPQRGRCV